MRGLTTSGNSAFWLFRQLKETIAPLVLRDHFLVLVPDQGIPHREAIVLPLESSCDAP